jgi:hypothetical protein
VFDVVLGDQQSWDVVCTRCGTNPGERADAD